MSQQESMITSATRTLGTLALAGLAITALQFDAAASTLKTSSALPADAGADTSTQLDPVYQVAQRLVLAGDVQLAAFRSRWAELPADFQLRLALAVRDLDSDRGVEVLAAMLDSSDKVVRTLVCDALRAETGQKLPDSSDLWKRWLDSEKTWLRVRGATLLADLRSSDEAAVVAATREIGEHRILKRAFADELERNLGRLSPAIRSVTASALGELGDSDSRGPLTGALGDLAPAVRREAKKALARLQPDLG